MMPTHIAAGTSRVIEIRKPLLGKNAEQATRNRERLRHHCIRVINLLSSPGAGKTTLLERTLTDLQGQCRCAVIVGDLATDHDAKRLEGKGAPIVQITTGTVCHLEADMIDRALADLDLNQLDVIFIENVGNLVCPANFDLGESARVVMLSATEGEDKPLKYPVIYRTADLVLWSKCDLTEALGVDPEQARKNASDVSPLARWLALSARTGVGMPAWYEYLNSLACTRETSL